MVLARYTANSYIIVNILSKCLASIRVIQKLPVVQYSYTSLLFDSPSKLLYILVKAMLQVQYGKIARGRGQDTTPECCFYHITLV